MGRDSSNTHHSVVEGRPRTGSIVVVVALVAAVFAALAPLDAHAQDARTLFQEGRARYDEADYESAIEAWEAAYELDPRPLLKLNLSQAYERLGRLGEATAALEVYLRDAPPDDPQRARSRLRLGELQERIERTGLVLRGGPDGAEVLIDGEARGTLPADGPFTVEPGNHQVEVRSSGRAPFRATVAVSAGQRAELAVTLPEDGVIPDPDVPDERSDSIRGPLGWGLTIGGAAVAVGAGVLGGVAMARMKGAETRDDADVGRARSLARATDVLLPLGAIAAGVGIVLLVLNRDRESEDAPRVQVTPAVGPTGVGASLRVRM